MKYLSWQRVVNEHINHVSRKTSYILSLLTDGSKIGSVHIANRYLIIALCGTCLIK